MSTVLTIEHPVYFLVSQSCTRWLQSPLYSIDRARKRLHWLKNLLHGHRLVHCTLLCRLAVVAQHMQNPCLLLHLESETLGWAPNQRSWEMQVKLSQWTCVQSCELSGHGRDLLQSSLFLRGFSTNMTQKHWLPLCGIHWYLTSQKVCIKTPQLPQNLINLPERQNCPSCCHDEQSSPQQVHINSKLSQNLQQKMTDCWKIVNEWYLFVHFK